MVWKAKKHHAQQGLQTNRSTTYSSLREAIMEANTNHTKRKAHLALLDHQEFLATSAGTGLWTMEPAQLTRIVKAFTDWDGRRSM